MDFCMTGVIKIPNIKGLCMSEHSMKSIRLAEMYGNSVEYFSPLSFLSSPPPIRSFRVFANLILCVSISSVLHAYTRHIYKSCTRKFARGSKERQDRHFTSRHERWRSSRVTRLQDRQCSTRQPLCIVLPYMAFSLILSRCNNSLHGKRWTWAGGFM